MKRFKNRFGRPSSVILLAACMVWTQAFSCATAIQDLKQWSPTVISAVSGIITLINPAAGSGLALASLALQKLFGIGGAVPAAISAYQANPGTGTLDELTKALAAANTQFSQALAAIQVDPNSNDAKAAEAGLLLLITTLEQFEARLGTTPPATQSAHMARAVKVNVQPAKNNAEFKTKWNALMTSNGHPEVTLH